MIDYEYAARNMRGVWRLAFGGDWRRDLDRSVDGVFRSFLAIPLAAPFSLLAIVSMRRAVLNSDQIDANTLIDAPFAVFFTAEAFAFVIDWAVSVAALALTARLIGASSRAGDAIIGFNWAQLIIAIGVSAPLAVLSMTADFNVISLFYLPALIFAMLLLWRVLRQLLPLDVGMAVALLAVLTLISIMTDITVTSIALALFHLFS